MYPEDLIMLAKIANEIFENFHGQFLCKDKFICKKVTEIVANKI